jgi:hypothetical protein
MMTALTIAGGLCLLLCIGLRGAQIAYEEARAEQAISDARLAWIDREIERVRAGSPEPTGRHIDPDDALPAARGAGILGPEDLR